MISRKNKFKKELGIEEFGDKNKLNQENSKIVIELDDNKQLRQVEYIESYTEGAGTGMTTFKFEYNEESGKFDYSTIQQRPGATTKLETPLGSIQTATVNAALENAIRSGGISNVYIRGDDGKEAPLKDYLKNNLESYDQNLNLNKFLLDLKYESNGTGYLNPSNNPFIDNEAEIRYAAGGDAIKPSPISGDNTDKAKTAYEKKLALETELV